LHQIKLETRYQKYLQSEARRLGISHAPTTTESFENFANRLSVMGRPFSFQGRDWLRSIIRTAETPHSKVWMIKSRQVGASTLMAALMIYRSQRYPHCTQMYVCDTQQHMHDFSVDKLLPMIESSGIQMSEDRQTRIMSYYFQTGSIIKIASGHGEFRQTRGPTIDFLYIDEAQSQEIDHMAVAEAAMTTSAHKCLFVAGTGSNEGDQWHLKWQHTTQSHWDDDVGEWQDVNQSNIQGYHIRPKMNPYWTQADDDYYRVEWGPYRYHTEWLGKFWSGGQIPLPPSIVEKCLVQSGWEDTRPQGQGHIFAGIDLAGGGAADTVIVICQMRGDILHVVYAERIDKQHHSDIYADIDRVLTQYSPDDIAMDAGGNDALSHEISTHYTVQKYRMGPQHDPMTYKPDESTISKTYFVQRAIQRFHDKTIRIPDMGKWITDQLTADMMETIEQRTGGSKIIYTKQKGRKDDLLMALTFAECAVYAKADPNNPNNRTISYSVGGGMLGDF